MDSTGATALHRAAAVLRRDAVIALLNAGAVTGRVDRAGDTALHMAIEAATDVNTAATAFALAAYGAPLDVRNAAGATPLELAGPNAASLQAAATRGPGALGSDDIASMDVDS